MCSRRCPSRLPPQHPRRSERRKRYGTGCGRLKFKIIGELAAIETIAAGGRLRDRRRLARLYGHGEWRKMKGQATVELSDGTILLAEIHWYEAHGIGKKEFKLKKPLLIE